MNACPKDLFGFGILSAQIAAAKRHLKVFSKTKVFSSLHPEVADRRIASVSIFGLAVQITSPFALIFVIALFLTFTRISNITLQIMIVVSYTGVYGFIIKFAVPRLIVLQEYFARDIVCLQMAYGMDLSQWGDKVQGRDEIEEFIDTAYSTQIQEKFRNYTNQEYLAILWRIEWLKDRFGFNLAKTRETLVVSSK